MKKILLFLLITITCFNLAGGYAIAASVLSQSDDAETNHYPQANTRHEILKKGSIDVQLLQVNKNEWEEDELLLPPLFMLAKAGNFYRYAPAFRVVNKHFLVHYAAAIKADLPAVYILHRNLQL